MEDFKNKSEARRDEKNIKLKLWQLIEMKGSKNTDLKCKDHMTQ